MQHIPCVKADSIPRHFLINIEGQIPYLGVGLETGVLQHIISFNGDSIPYGRVRPAGGSGPGPAGDREAGPDVPGTSGRTADRTMAGRPDRTVRPVTPAGHWPEPGSWFEDHVLKPTEGFRN